MTIYKSYQSFPELLKMFWLDKDKNYVLEILNYTCYLKKDKWVSRYDDSIVCNIFNEMKFCELFSQVKDIVVLTDKMCMTSNLTIYDLSDYQSKVSFVLELDKKTSFPISSINFHPTTKEEAVCHAISMYSIIEKNKVYSTRLFNIDIKDKAVCITLQIKYGHELSYVTYVYNIELKDKYHSTLKRDLVQELLGK